jgi:hypothetical protein
MHHPINFLGKIKSLPKKFSPLKIRIINKKIPVPDQQTINA